MVPALLAATYFIRERERRRMDLEIAALSRAPSIEEQYSSWAQELPYKDPIVFTGDSLIYWADWTYLFRQLDRDAPVILNRGISGNTSADLLRRWTANILAMKPKIVFVGIGTNDLSIVERMNDPELKNIYLRKHRTFSIERAKEEAIETFATNVLGLIERTPREIPLRFISILPVPPTAEKGPRAAWRAERNRYAVELNRWLKSLETRFDNVKYVDSYAIFHEENATRLQYFLGPDTSHINWSGYQVWAKQLFQYVK